jgi:hypothetical protein
VHACRLNHRATWQTDLYRLHLGNAVIHTFANCSLKATKVNYPVCGWFAA